jgi:hypothetical protein
METDKDVSQKETTNSKKARKNNRFQDWIQGVVSHWLPVVISVVISVLISTIASSIIMPWIHPLQSLILSKERVAIVDHPFSGDYSLIWHYTIRPNKEWRWEYSIAWAYFTFQVRELSGQDRILDLSGLKEIQFAIKSTKMDSKIEFNIFINDPFTQYTITDIPTSTHWRRVTIKVDELRPIHQMMPLTPDLRRVYSFGFAIKSFSELRSEEVYIDRIGAHL